MQISSPSPISTLPYISLVVSNLRTALADSSLIDGDSNQLCARDNSTSNSFSTIHQIGIVLSMLSVDDIEYGDIMEWGEIVGDWLITGSLNVVVYISVNFMVKLIV